MKSTILAAVCCALTIAFAIESEQIVGARRHHQQGFNKTRQAAASDKPDHLTVTSYKLDARAPYSKESEIPESSPEANQDSIKSLDLMHSHLKRAREEIKKIPSYSATIEQQVRIDDVVREPQRMDIKLRHEPFSVYIKWHDDGQEAVYVHGENENRVLVRPTRGVAALRGIWRLRPESPHAMRDNRYPVTELGIEKLCNLVSDFHENSLQSRDIVKCTHSEVEENGRNVVKFTLQFQCPETCPDYAESHLIFDKETSLLVSVENHSWSEDGKSAELLEKYHYLEFKPDHTITDEHFDTENPAYGFAKR